MARMKFDADALRALHAAGKSAEEAAAHMRMTVKQVQKWGSNHKLPFRLHKKSASDGARRRQQEAERQEAERQEAEQLVLRRFVRANRLGRRFVPLMPDEVARGLDPDLALRFEAVKALLFRRGMIRHDSAEKRAIELTEAGKVAVMEALQCQSH